MYAVINATEPQRLSEIKGSYRHTCMSHSKHKVPTAMIIMKGPSLADPPHVIGCRRPALQSWKEQATQCFQLLCGPAAALDHPLCEGPIANACPRLPMPRSATLENASSAMF